MDARSLFTGRVVLLPAELGRITSVNHLIPSTSNGGAAHTTRDQAIGSALLEVLERDAARCWLACAPPLSFALESLPKGLLDLCAPYARDYSLFDYCVSSTFQVSLSLRPPPRGRLGAPAGIFGTGCHWTPSLAIEKAVFEMLRLLDRQIYERFGATGQPVPTEGAANQQFLFYQPDFSGSLEFLFSGQCVPLDVWIGDNRYALGARKPQGARCGCLRS